MSQQAETDNIRYRLYIGEASALFAFFRLKKDPIMLAEATQKTDVIK
jgi:hypothetical protein